jgi:predicted secreted protein with PEFG-CTERM motif
MKFYTNFLKLFKSHKSSTAVIVLSTIALLIANFTTSPAFAQYQQLVVNGNVSSTINLGKTTIASNSTVRSSASVNSSGVQTQGQSNGNSQGNVQSQTSAQAGYQEHYQSSYPKMSSDSQNSFIVETNNHLYKPGDDVKIEGSIWSGLITELGGANQVSVQVLDNNGSIVNDGKAQINGDGQYSTDFTLPANARNGTYMINTKIEVSANLLSSLTLKTQGSLQSSENIVVASPNTFAITADGKDFDVKIASNSEVSNLQFDEQAKKVSFTVTGETGTVGVTDITIPKSLLSGDINVMIDGQVMSQNDVIETVDTQEETTLEINYHHSTHTIEIVGTNDVPEFPTSLIILTIAIMSIIAFSSKLKFARY